MNKDQELDTTSITRRKVLLAGAIAASAALPAASDAATASAAQGTGTGNSGHSGQPVGLLTTPDGTSLYFKDWGSGPVVVFSHGWPLDADAWDAQMFFLASKGFRVIAHDRRGHGRSSQPWQGNDMDAYADDLAVLLDTLDVRNVMLVGHSTGGGEVVRYIGRHGAARVSKLVLIGAVPPLMLKTEANPNGVPMEVFDKLRAGVLDDRSQTFKDLAVPFYGYNKPGAKASQGVIDEFWRIGMLSSIAASYDCIKAFSETDFTSDLKKIDVPTLILHGDADQIVPIADSAELTVKLVRNAKLKVIPGAPHGMCTTMANIINEHLLAFAKA